MLVILREKIRGLGDLGATVNVKPGYARNFLLPQGKGMRASADNLAVFETQRAELEKLEATRLQAAHQMVKQLESIVITINAKAGEGGKLFGSIGTHDLADALVAKGVAIERHQVRLPEGVLRQVGEYDVAVHLHFDVDSTVKVVIQAE